MKMLANKAIDTDAQFLARLAARAFPCAGHFYVEAVFLFPVGLRQSPVMR